MTVSYPGHQRDVCVKPGASLSSRDAVPCWRRHFPPLVPDAKSILEHLHPLPNFPAVSLIGPTASKKGLFLNLWLHLICPKLQQQGSLPN